MGGSQMKTAQELLAMVMDFVVNNFFNIIYALIVLLIGWFVARMLGFLLKVFLSRRNADVTITKFVADILKAIIIACAVLIALGNFGVTIAPFIAGISVLGFGTSFALQGPLSNYAAGATLIFTKPFKVGDILEMGSWTGEVENMTLARTVIRTLDGTLIVIPNKKIVGEVIHNYSAFKKLDIKVGVSYKSDIEKAISIVKKVVSEDKRVALKPQSKIGISEFMDSSVNIYARLWCKQADYWDLMFDVNKAIYHEFDKNLITIPFPQQDVHIYTNKEEKK